MAFWLGTLTLLGEIFMPQVMTVFAPGFAAMPEKFALTVELARITFPYLMLISLASLLGRILNSLNRFWVNAAAPILTKARLESVMRPRRNRPLFIIDIAMPRDVHPEVHAIDNVYVYNIDDLQSIVTENASRRSGEVREAERIIHQVAEGVERPRLHRRLAPAGDLRRRRQERLRAVRLRRHRQHRRLRRRRRRLPPRPLLRRRHQERA